jgi:hypothetical protein
MIPTCPYCGASARFLADSSSLYHVRRLGRCSPRNPEAREVMIPPGLQSNGGECFAALPQNPGLGQYMRCDAEILLLCVRGKVTMPPIKTRREAWAS